MNKINEDLKDLKDLFSGKKSKTLTLGLLVYPDGSHHWKLKTTDFNVNVGTVLELEKVCNQWVANPNQISWADVKKIGKEKGFNIVKSRRFRDRMLMSIITKKEKMTEKSKEEVRKIC